MRKIFGANILLLVVFFPQLVMGQTPSSGSEIVRECPNTGPTAPPFMQDQLYIVFHRGTESSRINEIHERLNVSVIKKNFEGRISLIRLPSGSTLTNLCEIYLLFPEVKAVNLNYGGIKPIN